MKALKIRAEMIESFCPNSALDALRTSINNGLYDDIYKEAGKI